MASSSMSEQGHLGNIWERSPRVSFEVSRPSFPTDLRVLLLEPDADAAVTAVAQLRRCGYTVETAASKMQALNVLCEQQQPFHVLLADFEALGGAGGGSQVSTLLAASQGASLVFMGCASSSAADMMAGINAGAVDFLDKPLSPLKIANIWQHAVRKCMAAEHAAGSPRQQALQSDRLAGSASPSSSSGTITLPSGAAAPAFAGGPTAAAHAQAATAVALSGDDDAGLLFDPCSLFGGCDDPLSSALAGPLSARSSFDAIAALTELEGMEHSSGGPACRGSHFGCGEGANKEDKVLLPRLPSGNSGACAGSDSDSALPEATSWDALCAGFSGKSAFPAPQLAPPQSATHDAAAAPAPPAMPPMPDGSLGMVWGMPMFVVATVPGLPVPPQTSVSRPSQAATPAAPSALPPYLHLGPPLPPMMLPAGAAPMMGYWPMMMQPHPMMMQQHPMYMAPKAPAAAVLPAPTFPSAAASGAGAAPKAAVAGPAAAVAAAGGALAPAPAATTPLAPQLQTEEARLAASSYLDWAAFPDAPVAAATAAKAAKAADAPTATGCSFAKAAAVPALQAQVAV